MRIQGDVITFDPADFDGLSDFAKKALPLFFGTNLDRDGNPVAEIHSESGRLLTDLVAQAKSVLVRQTGSDPEIDSIVRRLAAADQGTLDAARPVLDQLDAVLAGVVAASPR